MKRAFFTIIFIILSLFSNGCAVGVATYSSRPQTKEDIIFSFQKRLFFNTYHLQIINHSSKRAVEFYSNPVGGYNYYVELNNGAKISLDSKVFYYIGNKGRYWIYPGQTGSIPFEIKKSVMQNAKEIVFKGISYIPRMEGSFLNQDDMREITVVYDVERGKTSLTISDKVIPTPDVQLIFGNKVIEDLDKDYLDKQIDYNQFRLRGNKRD